MERRPRPSDEALLSRTLLTWLAIAGVVMGGGTLAVIWWAGPLYGEAVARTMGMVVFSISNVAFSVATKDERRSSFSLDVLADRSFLVATIVSIVTILLMAELDLLNRLLGTVHLDLAQWGICILVGLAILPIAEIRKRVWDVEEAPATAPPTSVPAAASP